MQNQSPILLLALTQGSGEHPQFLEAACIPCHAPPIHLQTTPSTITPVLLISDALPCSALDPDVQTHEMRSSPPGLALSRSAVPSEAVKPSCHSSHHSHGFPTPPRARVFKFSSSNMHFSGEMEKSDSSGFPAWTARWAVICVTNIGDTGGGRGFGAFTRSPVQAALAGR